MALNTEELIAVIAGSIAGLIVLLVVTAIILYLCVGRRRRDRRSDQKQFAHHHLTPDTSLSKNSALQQQPGDQRHLADPRLDTRLDPRLDPRMDPRLADPRLDHRLPKVGSSNLWFGTPSLYTAGPSQVYQDMKRKGPGKPGPEQPTFQGPPHGHVVYQGNAGRIYHSQQVAQAAYPGDYRLQRSGSYMDLYSYPYNYDPYKDIHNVENSRTALMEYHESGGEYYLDPYREREVRRTGRKVRRANSDVTQHSTRRAKLRKQRGEAPFDRQNSRDSPRDQSERRSHDSKERDQRRSQSDERQLRSDHVTRADVHKPKKQAPRPPKPKPKPEMTDPEVAESATDSAKLRAIEREKAREKENALRVSSSHVIADYSRDNRGYVHDEPKSKDSSELNVRTYNYEGKPSKYENSVIAKMAAMVETPKATLIASNKTGMETTTIAISSVPATTSSSTESFHAEVTKKLTKLQEKGGNAIDATEGPVMTSTGKNSRSSRPTSGRGRRQSGTDQDGNVITDEAFEFLDGYSDGEGTDFIGSGNITPTQMRDYDVTF